MMQILKRLEIIKSSILIEDKEIIELQIMKLNLLNIDEDVENIITKLENNEYSFALKLIENYTLKFTSIIVYEDKELLSLRFELKLLELKFQELIEEKTEYLNIIEEFNKEYSLNLGELIQSILNLEKEILYKKAIEKQKLDEQYKKDIETYEETKDTIAEIKKTIYQLEEILEDVAATFDKNYDEIKDTYNELKIELEKLENDLKIQEENLKTTKDFIENDEIKQEYEKANENYEEFQSKYEIIKDKQRNIINLSEEEKFELKKVFRKAAKLCHPDLVIDENKEKAHEIMQEINDAYSKQDLNKIKTILNSLENGFEFEIASDKINDKELLKLRIKEFEDNIENLKSEIESIKQDDSYQIIINLENWNDYFNELKITLEDKKIKLENESNNFLKENKKTSIKSEFSDFNRHLQNKDNYWESEF